jgi:hypothetical protein
MAGIDMPYLVTEQSSEFCFIVKLDQNTPGRCN